jgi:ketosteroid isomerase-like protein
MDDKRERTLAVPAALLTAARARDVAAVAACYAEDAVAISPMFGEARGRDRIAATWATLFSTFIEVTVADTAEPMVDDNRVAVFASLSTVDRIGWFGRPPTGETIAYRLVLIFTVVDGVIVRDERLYDSAGLLERLEKNRIDKELRTASEVQRALVPRTARAGQFCEWIGDSLPCRAIGGDFFEFIELPSGSVGIVLGDVAGKGRPQRCSRHWCKACSRSKRQPATVRPLSWHESTSGCWRGASSRGSSRSSTACYQPMAGCAIRTLAITRPF